MRGNLLILSILIGLSITFDAISTNEIAKISSLNYSDYIGLSFFILQLINDIGVFLSFGWFIDKFIIFIGISLVIKFIFLVILGVFYTRDITNIGRTVFILLFINISFLVSACICNLSIEKREKLIVVLPNVELTSIKIDKEEDCSICLQPMKEGCDKTNCNHIFHKECIIKHYKTSINKDCPICREPLYK